MGIRLSREEKEAIARSKEIDKYLLKSFLEEKSKNAKILLLGPSKAGKNTWYNHIKIIYGNGFTSEELAGWKSTVYEESINFLVKILEAMQKLGIAFGAKEREIDAKLLCEIIRWNKPNPFRTEVLNSVKLLWTDPSVQEYFQKQSHNIINKSSCQYFLNDWDRLSADGYIPTKEDFLRLSSRTHGGVHTQLFANKGVNLILNKVGGCRTERKRWIFAMEDVTVVIFIVPLSGYDCYLDYGDQYEYNQLRESLNLFESICNNKWFSDAVLVLLLNKKDIFEEKIKRTPLTLCFPEYKYNISSNLSEYEDGIDYINMKFKDMDKRTTRDINTFTTCGIDPVDTKFVFDKITDLILKKTIGGTQF